MDKEGKLLRVSCLLQSRHWARHITCGNLYKLSHILRHSYYLCLRGKGMESSRVLSCLAEITELVSGSVRIRLRSVDSIPMVFAMQSGTIVGECMEGLAS